MPGYTGNADGTAALQRRQLHPGPEPDRPAGVTSVSSTAAAAASSTLPAARPAPSQLLGGSMAEPFLSEIRIMSFNFAPKGWALCERPVPADQPEPGAVLAARHDLRRRRADELRPARPSGRVPIHVGGGHTLGERGGRGGAHAHQPGDADAHPRGQRRQRQRQWPTRPGTTSLPPTALYQPAPTNTTLAPSTITNVGRQPGTREHAAVLTLTFAIALQGIFPSQN